MLKRCQAAALGGPIAALADLWAKIRDSDACVAPTRRATACCGGCKTDRHPITGRISNQAQSRKFRQARCVVLGRTMQQPMESSGLSATVEILPSGRP
ncbi:hypothetical protein SAMN06295987_101706 [Novosphingobium mathurense]|uniref:Uncharacterized protein n=1 Tax=Novosphingobium mathurense TaxID=428990 RepID=A0A1U6GWM3_9SPHN|nr:hypothetical protein SAMN06295987_101706 [Novosphingobium mathurense]